MDAGDKDILLDLQNVASNNDDVSVNEFDFDLQSIAPALTIAVPRLHQTAWEGEARKTTSSQAKDDEKNLVKI